jgi:hypothetical protein
LKSPFFAESTPKAQCRPKATFCRFDHRIKPSISSIRSFDYPCGSAAIGPNLE